MRYPAQWDEDGQQITCGVTMKGSAKVALRKVTTTTLAVIFLCAVLPGCAVVGPLLSVGGLVGLAPLQYASTAYTVAEFSYEYAANDKDPSEVIEAKIDSVLTGKAFELPEFMPGYDAPEQTGETMVAQADVRTPLYDAPSNIALSADARQKRIEQVLGNRTVQFERMELRRMAFLKVQGRNYLSLRKTAMVTAPDLFKGAVDETSLR